MPLVPGASAKAEGACAIRAHQRAAALPDVGPRCDVSAPALLPAPSSPKWRSCIAIGGRRVGGIAPPPRASFAARGRRRPRGGGDGRGASPSRRGVGSVGRPRRRLEARGGLGCSPERTGPTALTLIARSLVLGPWSRVGRVSGSRGPWSSAPGRAARDVAAGFLARCSLAAGGCSGGTALTVLHDPFERARAPLVESSRLAIDSSRSSALTSSGARSSTTRL